MFKKKLSIELYLSLVTLCILINLLESWYFGLHMNAMSTAEYIWDIITSLPVVFLGVWFYLTNDFRDFIKGQIKVFIIRLFYGIMYGFMFK